MEEITIKVLVNGEELTPFNMGAGEEDPIYKDEIAFFSMGHIYNKEGNKAPYGYTIRLTRQKTDAEKKRAVLHLPPFLLGRYQGPPE